MKLITIRYDHSLRGYGHFLRKNLKKRGLSFKNVIDLKKKISKISYAIFDSELRSQLKVNIIICYKYRNNLMGSSFPKFDYSKKNNNKLIIIIINYKLINKNHHIFTTNVSIYFIRFRIKNCLSNNVSFFIFCKCYVFQNLPTFSLFFIK